MCIRDRALLQALQSVGEEYGMVLNQGKCEMLRFNSVQQVKFRDGSVVKVVDQAQYRGCYLNAWGDPMRELRRPIALTLATWKRMD
eukprot:11805847-Prorocentrum_lima.AAC.1